MTKTAAGPSGSEPGIVKAARERKGSVCLLFMSDHSDDFKFHCIPVRWDLTGGLHHCHERCVQGDTAEIKGLWGQIRWIVTVAEWQLHTQLHPLLADLRSFIFHVTLLRPSQLWGQLFFNRKTKEHFPQWSCNRPTCSYSIAGQKWR